MSRACDIQFPVLLTLEEATQGAQRDFWYARRHLLCTACDGSGRSGPRLCSDCRGLGATFLPRRVTVSIPPGMDSQNRVRLAGQGLLDADDGEWGNLELVCYLRSHSQFRRSGFDLHVTVAVPAVAGGEIEVPTLTGPRKLPCPPGPIHGPLRVPGHGLAKQVGGAERGDLLVELGPSASSDLRAQLPERCREARAYLAAGNAPQAVALLAALEAAQVLDVEGRLLLGSAYLQAGDLPRGRACLEAAADQEPGRAVLRYNAANAAFREGDLLAAALHLEAALRSDLNAAQARTALPSVLQRWFQEGSEQLRADPLLAPVAVQAAELTSKRLYGPAEALLRQVETQGCSGTARQELCWLRGCLLLLAGFTGNEAALPDAVHLLDTTSPAGPLARQVSWGLRALEATIRRDSGVVALAALAARCSSADAPQRALPAATVLVAALRNYHARIQHSPSDPLAVWEDQFIREQLSQLDRATTEATTPEAAQLHGLAALAEAHYRLRATGDVHSGWPNAIQAVRRLEVAVCLDPDDATLLRHFEQAVDLTAALAGALHGEEDPRRSEFYQNTCDAAVAQVLPGAPLNAFAQPFAVDPNLRAYCDAAADVLFVKTRVPLRGEFLVASDPEQFVLTNYRLLLLSDRLPHPQLLPLNVINRFTTRAAGLNVSNVVVGLGSGRQLVLNEIPNGTFPPDSVVNYLLASRMWEGLRPDEQEQLETGRRARQPASALQAVSTAPQLGDNPGVAPLPALGGAAPAPTRCPACTAPGKPGDRFCRRCGTRMDAGSEGGEILLALGEGSEGD